MDIPVSVIIRTFNEENNIEECVSYCKKNNPAEIIVVDGGSTDRTMRILESIKNIRVVSSEKGLARQRNSGLKSVCEKTKYVAIVDADDRLDKNCLRSLYETLESTNADAVQAKHECLSMITGRKPNYWEEAFLTNMKIIRDIDIKKSNTIEMVGRPALYRKEMLWKAVNNSSSLQFNNASEDSDLAYNLKKNGAVFVCGDGITYRKHLGTLGELYRRWLSYGTGDAKFIKINPERTRNVLLHVLYVYPVKRALYCVIRYKARYVPFFVLQGIVRFIGIVRYFMPGIGETDNYK